MSHSKPNKRGRSLYVEKWNPRAKIYINTCAICGTQGYHPALDADGFARTTEQRVIREELRRMLSPLPLDALGRCADCAQRMDPTPDRPAPCDV